MENDLKLNKKMEDDLKNNKDGRRPQTKWKTTYKKMEDYLKIKMEDNPQQKKGRRPKNKTKNVLNSSHI